MRLRGRQLAWCPARMVCRDRRLSCGAGRRATLRPCPHRLRRHRRLRPRRNPSQHPRAERRRPRPNRLRASRPVLGRGPRLGHLAPSGADPSRPGEQTSSVDQRPQARPLMRFQPDHRASIARPGQSEAHRRDPRRRTACPGPFIQVRAFARDQSRIAALVGHKRATH
jgi:hypothetical protein